MKLNYYSLPLYLMLLGIAIATTAVMIIIYNDFFKDRPLRKKKAGEDFQSINPAANEENAKVFSGRGKVTETQLSKNMKKRIEEQNRKNWKYPRFIPCEKWKAMSDKERRDA